MEKPGYAIIRVKKPLDGGEGEQDVYLLPHLDR